MANKRRNGEGSWGRKTINGIKYYTYRDSKGKTTYGKTQKEVKEKLANKPAEYAISQKTTFGEYISNWLTFKQGEVEITTYQDYEDLINNMIINFKKYNLAKKQLNALSPRIFQQYLNALATKYSRSSIVKIWQLIKQCIKYGELQNELPVNTTALVKVPLESNVAVKKKEIPFLTVEQADQLYEVLNYRDKNNASRYKSSNNAHAIILILYTGMRMGELIALKWKNVNISQKSIYIKEAAATIKNEDGKTVAAVDLEVPGAGELMGGSQREEDYDKLIERKRIMKQPTKMIMLLCQIPAINLIQQTSTERYMLCVRMPICQD